MEEAQFPSQFKGEENSEEEQYEDEDEGDDPQRDSENELSETSFDGSEVTFRRPMEVVESEQFEHLRVTSKRWLHQSSRVLQILLKKKHLRDNTKGQDIEVRN